MAADSRHCGAVLEIGQAALWEFPSNMPEAEKARLRDRILGHTIPMDAPRLSRAEPRK